MQLTFRRSGALRGEYRPPSDKSLTHRAYMLAAVADSSSEIHEPLTGEDCEATLRCVQLLGAKVDRPTSSQVVVTPPLHWVQPSGPLDCGNSGTTMRLLSGLIASRPLSAVMVGDASLSRRPMKRIAEPLRLMGASVEGDTPPLTIQGSDLQAIEYESSVASAQVKSCVLLAGLRAEGATWVREPSLSRDHTERMLQALGAMMLGSGTHVGVLGGSRLRGFSFTIPADISSAAFLLVAAALIPGSEVLSRSVGVNPTRTGILDVFDQAGVRWSLENPRETLGEPVADIAVTHGFQAPFEIAGDLVPRLIDEIPILAVLATQLPGVSRIRDAAEMRVKETDRIEQVAQGLRAMGAKVETHPDGMDIEGPTPLTGTTIDAAHDHRIAMAFAVAGMIADGETRILGAQSIQTSYPTFLADLETLGYA